MRPGERVTAIKGIARKLSEETWTDIGLTLDQFGFGTWFDQGNPPSPYEHIVEKLKEGADDNLLALEEFLFPGVDGGPGVDDGIGGPWADGQFRLFVSHTHAHTAFASSLRRALAEMGIDAFVAHDRIEPTSEWQDEIELALKTCDALVAVLTDDFVASDWCDQEVGYCMARGLLIVPLGLGVNPHGFIGKYQCMTAREDEDAHEVASRIFELLLEHEKTAEQMAPTIARQIVDRYAESHSFDNARENFELLKSIPKESWTPELAEIVESAPDENSQIAFARTGIMKMPEAASNFLDEMLDRPPSVTQGQAEEEDLPF